MNPRLQAAESPVWRAGVPGKGVGKLNGKRGLERSYPWSSPGPRAVTWAQVQLRSWWGSVRMNMGEGGSPCSKSLRIS